MSPKRIGFLIYPAMQALDLVGPMDAFSAVTLADGKGRRRHGYEVLTIGFDAKPVPAESGLLLTPQFTTATAPKLDTLVIPGGSMGELRALGTDFQVRPDARVVGNGRVIT